MNRRSIAVVVGIAALNTLSLSMLCQTIGATGTYKNAPPGWDRGMETTMHCGHDPESWVRGSAVLDKSTGVLSLVVQLETDSILAGPKGRVTANIHDASGQLIYKAVSDEIGIGGKPPGRAVMPKFSSQISIPTSISMAANTIDLDAECTGSITRLFNVDLVVNPNTLKVVKDAFSKAGQVSQPGTAEYTASLRQEISGAPSPPKPQKASPTSLDNDARYRDNFSDQTRVYGGDVVAPGTFPDTVAITGNHQICTGVVIGAKTVLTAAHCFCGGVKETIYFGDSVLHAVNTASVTGGSSMIPCDPQLQLDHGDVAILTTNAILTIPPRAFASSGLINRAKFGRVVGFGIGMNPMTDPAGIKRMIDVPMASPDCKGMVQTASGGVQDSAYYRCAAGQELVAGAHSLDRDTCKGDSGGPLYVLGTDGTLYLAATTSRATGTPGMRECGDGGIYVRTDGTILTWLKSQNIEVFTGPSQ
jgi:hypothetical protein